MCSKQWEQSKGCKVNTGAHCRVDCMCEAYNTCMIQLLAWSNRPKMWESEEILDMWAVRYPYL
jgi:hypothetical protein